MTRPAPAHPRVGQAYPVNTDASNKQPLWFQPPPACCRAHLRKHQPLLAFPAIASLNALSTKSDRIRRTLGAHAPMTKSFSFQIYPPFCSVIVLFDLMADHFGILMIAHFAFDTIQTRFSGTTKPARNPASTPPVAEHPDGCTQQQTNSQRALLSG